MEQHTRLPIANTTTAGKTNTLLATCGALSSILFASVLVASCNVAAPERSEADTVAQKLWDKLLTQCGDSYFYAGSVFDASGMLSNLGAGGRPTTMEYKKPAFNIVPEEVSEAEKLNGLEYHGRVTMVAGLYREKDSTWSDGPDRQTRNVDDIIGRALSNVGSDMGQMGTSGAIALDLLKVKGTWAVARSSVNLSGSIISSKGYYDVQKLADAPTAKYDCAKAAVVTPPREADGKKAPPRRTARKS